MKYEVILLPRAYADIDEAVGWIAQYSPLQADRWHQRLRAAIQSLEHLPERCPLAPESLSFTEEIRQLLFGRRQGRYRILFTVANGKVFVMAVRHGARKAMKPKRQGRKGNDHQ